MDGFDVLKYLRGQPRFHPMVAVALLNERDGILVRLKARLAGAQQVVTKPLVRQRIVALVSEYAWAARFCPSIKPANRECLSRRQS